MKRLWNQSASAVGRAASRAAFTLTELLVVISLLVIIVLIGLPAFGALLYGSERTLAEAQLRVALTAARDAAIRGEGSDGAAVFFVEPDGRLSIVPCVKVGVVKDRPGPGQNDPDVLVERDVFAPIPTVEAVELPPGWVVRAFAAPGVLHDANSNNNGWYAPWPGREYNGRTGSWVFPETGFYDPTAVRDSGPGGKAKRCTFMVRFEAGSGQLKLADSRPAVVVAPRADRPDLSLAPAQHWKDPLRSASVANWSKRLLARPLTRAAAPGSITQNDLNDLIRDESGNTVLAASVSIIALYDESRLASAIGARGVSRTSGTLYRNVNDAGAAKEPAIDGSLFPGGGLSPVEFQRRVDQWMLGRLQLNGRDVPSEAIVLTMDKYTGQPREMAP